MGKENGKKMKRSLVLLIILAIVASAAVTSFALYSRSIAPADTGVKTKVFNLFSSPPYSVTESKAAENVSAWKFTVFNTTTRSSDHDLVVSVSMNTTSTGGLRARIYNHSIEIGSAIFSGSTADVVVSNFVPANTTATENLELRLFYNDQPLTPSNCPFPLGTAYFTVSAYGREAENIIEKIMSNRWCSSLLNPNRRSRVQVSSYMYVPPVGEEQSIETQINVDTGSVEIVYSAPLGTLTFTYTRGGSTTTHTFSAIDPSGHLPPDAVVLAFNDFDQYNNITITNLDLNGSVYAGPYREFGANQAILISSFNADADGSFRVSFDYSKSGNFQPNSGDYEFGIYLGYQ